MEHLHPKQAYDIVTASPNTLLIDCRTEVEFYYVGHPTDAINIEWNRAPDFELNPHFADEVLRIPLAAPFFEPLLAVVPLHIFAMGLATAKVLDVDQPRNLAKSVTVE